MKNKFSPFMLLVFALWSCSSSIEEEVQTIDPGSTEQTIKDLNVPSSFNYETSQKVTAEVDVKSLSNTPLAGVKVSFYTNSPELNGKFIASAFTNNSGKAITELQVPTYLEDLFVHVHTIGFNNQQMVPVTPSISLDFGGTPPVRRDVVKSRNTDPIHITGNYYYFGDFNSSGLPSYLEPTGDNLSQKFLDDVNASLPEDRPVPTYNPQYLTTGNELDIIVKETSDVWITFVTEGAGYRNSLGFYVFDTNNPPSTASEIDSIFVVLPNASLAGSGGQLYAGDKVHLGRFQPGKTISWVLFQNAWTGSGVNVNKPKFYSRSDFNTIESNPTKKQHTVQLTDIGRQILLNGFEDLTRSESSDDDFNDLVFYVSANPWEAIETGGIPQVTPSTDTDGDGVSDESDDFPNDPSRALRNTYTGSLAFEDLWPAQGDYDFNDLVIDYEIDHILNGENLLVEIEADWTIKAVFASYKNGFGVKFKDLPVNDIASVTGLNLKENIITLNGNSTEANQGKATLVFFDNVFNVVQEAGSPYPHTTPVTLSSTITMNNPISQNLVGLPPYNPFIFINGERDKEVHLPGHQPTDLADVQLFGTSFDATNFSTGYYYKTTNGLPWAIHISESFDFPKEGAPIDEAYNHFANWATSGGISNKDWYLNLANYRNSSKIY